MFFEETAPKVTLNSRLYFLKSNKIKTKNQTPFPPGKGWGWDPSRNHPSNKNNLLSSKQPQFASPVFYFNSQHF